MRLQSLFQCQDEAAMRMVGLLPQTSIDGDVTTILRGWGEVAEIPLAVDLWGDAPRTGEG